MNDFEPIADHFDQALKDVRRGTEESGYPELKNGLDLLCPPGFEAKAHTFEKDIGKPDLSIVRKSDGGIVVYIEVKKPNTLRDAFKAAASGESQISRYRHSGLPVLLTDCLRWFDVTTADNTERPFAVFRDEEQERDQTSATAIEDFLSQCVNRKPRYRGVEAAIYGIDSVIRQLDENPIETLETGWGTVREALGFEVDPERTLDGEGSGEVIAFSLLSMAALLPPIGNDAEFVQLAREEWQSAAGFSKARDLPPVLKAALDILRLESADEGLVVDRYWVTLRSIADWMLFGKSDRRWARMSEVWDGFLALRERRKKLGSWQTPMAVAALQAQELDRALATIGYAGLRDTRVTILDPCVGTGVYPSAVVQQIESTGGTAISVNKSEGNAQPRLIGFDISATAITCAHIRLSASPAEPRFHMVDTLSVGADEAQTSMSLDADHANQLVVSANRDQSQARRWAARDGDRPPILAIIGNPPYERSALDETRYEKCAWHTDVYQSWKKGSGGRGSLQDPAFAFWAWALSVFQQPHGEIDNDLPFGIVSYITNRSWIAGDTAVTMRKKIASAATKIEIWDFGPGARGGGGGKWSDQPFEIQTGTAIATVTFGRQQPDEDSTCTLNYRKAEWVDGEVRAIGETESRDDAGVLEGEWLPRPPGRPLTLGIEKRLANGVKTGTDKQWIKTIGNRDFATRHAYRVLDNRWSPTSPPEKTKQGEEHSEGKATQYARWNEKKLFDPHSEHVAAGGWYAILPPPAVGVKPGPAIHATIHVPDYHAFKGSEGGKVVRVAPGVGIPHDYQQWASDNGIGDTDFWLAALAIAHHENYWASDTEEATQLSERAIALDLPADADVTKRLVKLGSDLVRIWSLDDLEPTAHSGKPGEWKFDAHDRYEHLEINGYKVLSSWRKARDETWSEATAIEYARTLKALSELVRIRADVAQLVRV